LPVIGMFFTVIYSIPQIEHILDPIFFGWYNFNMVRDDYRKK